MSYILEALRRADAERQRGAVPGLHAQPVAGVLTEPAAAPGTITRRLGLAAGALLLLGLAVAAGWQWRPAGGPDVPAAVMQAPAAPPPTVATVPQAPAQMPAQVPASMPLPPGQAPTLRSPPPLPGYAPVSPAGAARRPAAAAPPVTSAAATPKAPAPALAASAAAPARLPSLAELPEAQKRELGPLVVGGAMHAEQAALRIVILNGQVFHEGDKLGPDLQVRQIRLNSVVMEHRGQRFELPF